MIHSDIKRRLVRDIHFVTGRSPALLNLCTEARLRIIFARYKCSDKTTDTTGTALAAGHITQADRDANKPASWEA